MQSIKDVTDVSIDLLDQGAPPFVYSIDNIPVIDNIDYILNNRKVKPYYLALHINYCSFHKILVK